MNRAALIAALAASLLASNSWASAITFTTYAGTGVDAAALTPIRDAFRAAIGGGSVAGANGSFGGVRREINWDGVPAGFSDPNLLPGSFLNVNSPRGAVLSTPGTGFLVSAAAGGATPILFGFPGDLQTFSAQKLFTAVNRNITDVSFFVPGTSIAAATSAFGVIFVDAEDANLSGIEFFDENNASIYSAKALATGNQGLSFLGAVADNGGRISRVRITSGLNTLIANGVRANEVQDFVMMDDFIYAEPTAAAVPEPASLLLLGAGVVGLAARRWRR